MVDVREGRITDLQRFGNSEADRLAKEGAEPFRASLNDRLRIRGYMAFLRRVGVFRASQQVECRELCVHEVKWLSYVLLGAVPVPPLPWGL
eukprot:5174361-Pyramimonas_sp.AAC.1